jgi:hypothetical protein
MTVPSSQTGDSQAPYDGNDGEVCCPKHTKQRAGDCVTIEEILEGIDGTLVRGDSETSASSDGGCCNQ